MVTWSSRQVFEALPAHFKTDSTATLKALYRSQLSPFRATVNTPYWYGSNWSARSTMRTLGWDTKPTNARKTSLTPPHFSLPTAAIMPSSPAGVHTVLRGADPVAETRQRMDDADKSFATKTHQLSYCSNSGLTSSRGIRFVCIAMLRSVCLQHTKRRALWTSKTPSKKGVILFEVTRISIYAGDCKIFRRICNNK